MGVDLVESVMLLLLGKWMTVDDAGPVEAVPEDAPHAVDAADGEDGGRGVQVGLPTVVLQGK